MVKSACSSYRGPMYSSQSQCLVAYNCLLYSSVIQCPILTLGTKHACSTQNIFRQNTRAHKKKLKKKDDMKQGCRDGSSDILSKVDLGAASGSKHPTCVIMVKPHEECQRPMMSA